MGERTSQFWFGKPAGRPVRPAGFAILLLGAVQVAQPQPAVAANTTYAAAAEDRSGPQWISVADDRAAQQLIALLQSSRLDGLDPDRFDINSLKKAVIAAEEGKPGQIAKANALLDQALVAYVAALREAPTEEWIVNDREAIPLPPPPRDMLVQAANAPSLAAWIQAMPFMHHSYAGLRRALLLAESQGDQQAAELLRLNLKRVRLLPASGRYVLVNIAAQRLDMYEDGQVADTMKVVVGKQHHPTPMMAATIKFTALNPYWQVPADLAAERVAPNVVKEGLSYLEQLGYLVLSDWGEQAALVDPATVDWEAVAAGRVQVRLRQEPGPHNAMGRMKFVFPNPQGIFLHDTPNKELLKEDSRLFSGGCVRLEDAPRLAIWLHGRPLHWRGARTEQTVELEQPIPVYLVYLTAEPSGNQIVFHQDIYGKDRSQLARSGEGRVATR